MLLVLASFSISLSACKERVIVSDPKSSIMCLGNSLALEQSKFTKQEQEKLNEIDIEIQKFFLKKMKVQEEALKAFCK